MISPYAFPGMIDKPVGKIEFEDIESKVCELFNTTVDKLLVRSRRDEIVTPKHMCIYLARKYVKYSTLNSIGRRYGNMDHTSISHAIKAVENRRATEKEYDEHVDSIEKYLKGFNPYSKKYQTLKV